MFQGQQSVAHLSSPSTGTRGRTLLVTGGRFNPVHALVFYTYVCVCLCVCVCVCVCVVCVCGVRECVYKRENV